jgi:nucleoid-associated protein YgaU
MKVMKIVLYLILALSLSSVSTLYAQSYNYEEMEMDEYNALLQEWQGRLDAGNQAIATEDTKVGDLTSQGDDVQGQIDTIWDEIYAALGSSKAEDDEFKKQIQSLRSDVSALLAMSPDEIYRRKDEIQGNKDRLAELRTNNLALLSDNMAALDNIESMINQAEEKAKPVQPDTYTVMRGDFLWRIAGMNDIYGDPYAWSRIYTSNRDMIKDPDLIYPAQIFQIPRDVGPNEHLVVKGEFLSKISGYGNVYGSPFKWQKLYEANKGVVTDPNVIYPYQVLMVPRN